MKTRSLTGVVVAIALCAAFFAGGSAFAGSPPSTGQPVIPTVDFEGPTPSLTTTPVVIQGVTTTAYWGVRAGFAAHPGSGTQGLWCAGTLYPSHSVSTTSTYPEGTSGSVTLALPELADYYSADLSFWYLMPSLGTYDDISLGLAFGEPDAGGDLGGSAFRDGGSSNQIPLAATWTLRPYDLTGLAHLSRTPGEFVVNFIDRAEPLGLPTTGQGPAIDDINVTGFKYGPVRLLGAAPSGAQKMTLTWARPYRSVGETSLEERSITYRVWRSPRGQGVWTELTADNNRLPNSALSFDDTTDLRDGTPYEYVVQAWDSGLGEGYGELAKSVAATTSGSPVALETTMTTQSSTVVVGYGGKGTVQASLTDTDGPMPGCASGVVLQVLSGSTWTTVTAGGVGVTDAGSGVYRVVTPALTSKASYRLHYAGDGSGFFAQSADSGALVVLPHSSLTRPSGKSTAAYGKVYSMTGTLRPRHLGTATVKIIGKHLVGKTWKTSWTKSAKTTNVSTYSKFALGVKLARGKWRFYSRYVDANHATTTTTSYLSVTCK